jgi:hypothetical protein
MVSTTPLGSELASPDAPTGYRAICRLARHPREAVAFLARRFQPSARRALERIRRLVADLDSDTFALRRQAATDLAAPGESARPALEEAQERLPSAEVHTAARHLLKRLTDTISGEHLRDPRAMQALERSGSLEAQRVLKVVSGGDRLTRRTQEASAALRRLARCSRQP